MDEQGKSPPLAFSTDTMLARYRRIVEAAGYVIFTANEFGIFTHVSESAIRLTGYAAAELVDEHFTKLVHPDWRERVAAFYNQQFAAREKETTFEFPILTRDGEQRWVEQTVFMIAVEGETAFQAITHDVTERHETEHQLRAREALYRTLARNLPNTAVMVFDHNLRFIVVEGSVLANHGLTSSDAEGTTLEDFLSEAEVAYFKPLYRDALAGNPRTSEIAYGGRLYRKQIVPLFGDDGGISGGMAVVQDITDQRHMEEELRENNRRFKGLFEQNLDAVFRIDLDGVIREVNQQAAEMLGYSVEEIVGSTAKPFVKADERDDTDRMLEVVKSGQEIPIYERTLVRSDGTEFPAEVNVALVRDADGNPSHIQSILRDISERKQTALQLAERVQQLTTLREIDAELAERLDVDYVLTMALDSAMRLSGASAGYIGLLDEDGVIRIGEVKGDYPQPFADDYLQRGEGIVGRVMRAQTAELIADVGADPDYTANNPNTRTQMTIPLVSHERLIGVLNLESANPNMFTEERFGLIKLVTARIAVAIDNARLHRQTELHLAELQTLYERVSNLEQLKSDMIRIASHDLRNPLTGILGYIEMMRMEELLKLPEAASFIEYLDTIEEAAVSMRKIILDILSLERIEHSAANADYETLDLAQLVKTVCEENQSQLKQRSRELSCSLPEGAVIVRGDPAQLQEAISNFIGNAIKYTEEGGHIDVRLWRETGCAIVEVQDDGCGIPVEMQAKLFKPFSRARTKENERIEGTGLGLHLVKNIVERHGGEVRFRSVYSEGSTFGFSLPLVDQ